MPSLTKNEAAMLGRRRPRPALGPDELVAVFIAKPTLVNPKNAGQAWQQKAWGRYKREWREAVAQALLEYRTANPWFYLRAIRNPFEKKRVVFHATVPREIDRDGLALSLAAALDSLLVIRRGAGILSDDAPSHGHLIDYTQDVQPKRGTLYGVRIGISLRDAALPPQERDG